MEFVVTAVGPDRPGIVELFTGRLFDAGGNLADSRMVNLRGQFALVLLAAAPDDQIAEIEQVLLAAGEEGRLVVSFTRLAPGRPAAPGLRYRLKTYSVDQPGIVHRVTSTLHRHGVNVEELETRLESAPFDGVPLFMMDAVITVPRAVPIRQLRDDLDHIGSELNIDLDLEPETR